jgi:hypothetical protein
MKRTCAHLNELERIKLSVLNCENKREIGKIDWGGLSLEGEDGVEANTQAKNSGKFTVPLRVLD